MRKLKLIAGAALACLAFGVSEVSAHSILIVPSVPVVTAVAGGFSYNYTAEVTAGSNIQAGDFFTIVDFAGLVPGSAFAPAGWTVTTPNTVGVPDVSMPGNFMIVAAGPPPSTASVPDSASTPDLLFVYTGPKLEGQISISGFGAVSIQNKLVRGSLMAQDHSDDVVIGGVTTPGVTVANTDSPFVPAAIPLPSTASTGLALMGGLGLLTGVNVLRRRRQMA